MVACLLLYAGASAEKVFDFSLTCQRAYQQINSLKLDSGEQLVNQARKENPDNLIPEILDSYIDFYILSLTKTPKIMTGLWAILATGLISWKKDLITHRFIISAALPCTCSVPAWRLNLAGNGVPAGISEKHLHW